MTLNSVTKSQLEQLTKEQLELESLKKEIAILKEEISELKKLIENDIATRKGLVVENFPW